MSTQEPNNIFKSVTSELSKVCQSAFSVLFSGYIVKNSPSNAMAPITLRASKEIILNCNLSCAGSIAFQLSHELCHASINDTVSDNLRWLEESFAVLSSRYFPYKIKSVDDSLYSSFFKQAFDALIPKCEIDWPLSKNTVAFLESGSGTRNYNDYGSYLKISDHLIPIANSFPDIWKCVPYIYKIPANLTFEQSLSEWKSIVPSDIRHVITVIESTFFF